MYFLSEGKKKDIAVYVTCLLLYNLLLYGANELVDAENETELIYHSLFLSLYLTEVQIHRFKRGQAIYKGLSWCMYNFNRTGMYILKKRYMY